MRLVVDLLWDNPFRRWMLESLVLVNALGSLYGYWWYHQQLASTPPAYWLFVPDSPLSSTWMTLALLLLLAGRRPSLFLLLAYTAVSKYGLWAALLIGDYWWRGGPPAFTEVMLFTSHLGMALEGVIYWRHLPYRRWQAAAVGGWMFLNDYVDYAWDLHPYLFRADQWALALAGALGLSALLTVGALRAALRK